MDSVNWSDIQKIARELKTEHEKWHLARSDSDYRVDPEAVKEHLNLRAEIQKTLAEKIGLKTLTEENAKKLNRVLQEIFKIDNTGKKITLSSSGDADLSILDSSQEEKRKRVYHWQIPQKHVMEAAEESNLKHISICDEPVLNREGKLVIGTYQTSRNEKYGITYKYRILSESGYKIIRDIQNKWQAETGATRIAEGLRKVGQDKYETSNCHGLAFANGMGQIENENARLILDQDYEKVETYEKGKSSTTKIGDVISYENSKGMPVHTGRIVGFEEVDGIRTPVVISKWSHFAIYKHQPMQVLWTYLEDGDGKFNIAVYRKKL